MAAPDSVVSRCPDGTQLEVLRATGAEDEEVGAGGGGGRERHGPGSRESEVGTPGAPSNCRKRKETGQGSPVTGSVCGRPAAC